MPDLSFPNLPSNWKLPLFWLEFANGGQGGLQQQQSLLIGQTVTAQPAAPVWVASVAQAIALFGAGSALAQMVQKYLKADPAGALYCLPIADNGGGTAAGGSLSVSGTATAPGVLSIYVGGRLVSVPVTSGMTNAQAATAIVAALTVYVDADGVKLPVSAAVDGTNDFQVNLTANHKGVLGNSIDVRMNYYGSQAGEAVPAGFSVTVSAMSGGATNPTMPELDTALANVNYDFIAIAWNDTATLNVMKDLMANADGRWSYLEQAYGHVWAAKRDADATGGANITFGEDRNDQHCTIFSYEPMPATDWEVAAAAMGGCAASLRADPARPLQTLSVPGLLPPPVGSRYTLATAQELLSSGMALFSYLADGSVSILRAVTTYQKNAYGTTDTLYLDTETLYTAMAVSRQLKSDALTAFPRAKLVADGTSFGPGTSFTNGQPDQPVATPGSIKAAIIASYRRMMKRGLVQNIEAFIAGLIVQINSTDPTRVDVGFDPKFASGLRALGVLMQPSLSAAA